ncbi:hypothetical protein A33Q_4224 [Indibacter alkaliphilus LW1]|uniref:Uncharacterized protein n=1 Tax=Indibacter alkaliphilus (strain CCUG 57479 / KCTC 22604 / LW1) TaxID=1189612 RepID=S2DJI3_INDAL|nr:hypothetical protein A33Q_4224 [Indibacter alkaliphilus LW1]
MSGHLGILNPIFLKQMLIKKPARFWKPGRSYTFKNNTLILI